jgi:hypothetical protein
VVNDHHRGVPYPTLLCRTTTKSQEEPDFAQDVQLANGAVLDWVLAER